MIKEYMLPIYEFLLKKGVMKLEQLPEGYQVPVAQYMAQKEAESQKEIEPQR